MKLTRRSTLGLVAGMSALALSAALATSAFAAATAAPARSSTQVRSQDVAARDRGHMGGHVLTAAATYIGITEAQLRTELQGGKSLAEIAVAHGKTRDGLIAALTQAAGQGLSRLVDEKGLGRHARPGGPVGPAGKPGHGFRQAAQPFAAASAYLGIAQADLMARLRAGETLAAIANATPGKGRDGLLAALVADAHTSIDKGAAAGKIPADRVVELKAKVAEHTARLIDEAHKRR
ncbi:MAG: hypothetical protein H0V71_10835 [Chloroflexi bacterium]|nr:hypothetical protein [Chloroflexota bacterium]MDQ3399388.1 hypothetical protein [Chloroflexota bacterium]